MPWSKDGDNRPKGVGGSAIWYVVNDPMAEYVRARGIVGPMEETTEMKAGHYFEDGNARWFQDETGYRLRGDGYMSVQHPTEAWACASPDRFVYDAADVLVGGWEGKNISVFQSAGVGGREPDEYDVPERHYLQIIWCMGVTGLRRWWYSPLVGGNKPRHDHVIEADDALFADLLKIARAFWFGNVLAGVAPEVDGGAASAAYLRATYAKPTREELPPAPDEALALAETYLDASEIASEAEDRKQEAGNKIKDIIGRSGAPGLMLDASWPVTWKPNAKGVRTLNLKRRKS